MIMSQLNLFRNPYDKVRYEALKPRFMQIKTLVNWEAFRQSLEKALAYNSTGQGRKPFDPILMFKIMVLQHFYDLSHDAMEFQLRDRQSFREFVGLHANASIPDAKTIWLFHDKLADAKMMTTLFDQVLQQIDDHGFIAQGGQMVDASLMESRKPTQRRTREEIEALAENMKCQIDSDATFTKKHNKSYHGYKGHTNVDVTHKIVRKIEVTTAKDGDITVVDQLMDDLNTKNAFYGDSAYKSREMDDKLAAKAIVSRINRKAYRNKPLNGHDKRFNRTSSRVRSRVEHVYGQVKLWGKKLQVRSIGIKRATLGIGMKFMVYNLNRWRFLEEEVALKGVF